MKSHWVRLGVVALTLAACEKKSEIQVYRVVKAPVEESTSSAGQSMPTNVSSPGMQPATAPMVSGAATTTTVPPNWQPQPLSQMRQASFVVKGDNGAVVDISLVSLGTSAANVLDNVNRWLGQLGQPPITEAKLGQVSEHLTTSIGDVAVFDLPGLPKDADPAKDGRIIAAMVAAPNGTLFFKMRGNAELTEAQKPDFMKWVSAVCSQQRTPQQTEALSMPANEGSAPQIKWKTPNGWNQVPASSMRYASFNATEPDGAKVDVSVVTFPGDGGSDAENVNRWRRQIGLEPVDEKGVAAAITPVNANGSEFAALDMTGGDSRVVAAWTRRNGRAWFFKMTGPAAAVEKEKSKFLDFLRSIDFQS